MRSSVTVVPYFAYKWTRLLCFWYFLNGKFLVKHLSGNKRWARGQLEELPGQRQEEQGEKEPVLPQAPESQDGTEGMML